MSIPNMKVTLFSISIFFLVSVGIGEEIKNHENPVLAIRDGLIRGRKAKTEGAGKTYYQFRGIPYAKPPVGNLRFRSPVENDKWEGIRDATEDGSVCTARSNPVQGSEDCLFVNVYSPSIYKQGYPVIAFIHGGGFSNGDCTYRHSMPEYFLDDEVVFVTFQYRLGVFGFLSTEDLSCSGNWGLKDQVLALQWIQKNIEYFGGDPNRVTIMGNSAGAASVSYLLQTNATTGLFNAAIMQSGNSLALWGLNRIARKVAFGIGRELGIQTTNSTALMEKIRGVDYKILQSSALKVASVINTNTMNTMSFTPVIEPPHKEAFFSSLADELLRQGNFHRVPLLLGFNRKEGRNLDVFTRTFLSSVSATSIVPADLTENQTKLDAAADEIRSHYFTELPISLQYQADNVYKFIGDNEFIRPTIRTVLNTMNYTKVYFYEFTYKGILGKIQNGEHNETTHGEEMAYLLRPTLNHPISSEDRLVRQRMVRLWTNFAKYHKPTPTLDYFLQNITWLETNYDGKGLKYLDINLNLTMQMNPFNDVWKFWNRIYDKYGDPPYSTF